EQLKEMADNCAAVPGETAPIGSNADSNEDLSVPEPLAFETSDLSGPATERSNGPPIMRVEALNAFTSDLRRDDGHTKRLMAVFGIAGLVAILIAIAAYRLRDRPEDLVRMQALPAQQHDTASGDKIADRVGADRAGAGDQEGPGVVPSLPVA